MTSSSPHPPQEIEAAWQLQGHLSRYLQLLGDRYEPLICRENHTRRQLPILPWRPRTPLWMGSPYTDDGIPW